MRILFDHGTPKGLARALSGHILLSDDHRPSALTVGFAAGASFFLYKPIDKDRLFRLVRATQGPLFTLLDFSSPLKLIF